MSTTSVSPCKFVEFRRPSGSSSPCGTLNRSRRRRSSPSGLNEIDIPDDSSNLQRHDLVARSLSFKTNDSDCCQTFFPNDLEIRELLGKGCFGEVYKVVHRTTGVVMVLKCLYRIDPKCEKDFLKEAAFMRQLSHPNVVGFLGILYKEKKLHIISEFISGGSLRNCLDTNVNNLTWLKRVSIAKDVAAGMSYLHGKNIIHRDLTSSNILLRLEDGSAVVADFGLARMLTRRRLSRKRRLTVVGNPYTMAPEMMNEKAYDERADIFSYGITLCETIAKCNVDPDELPRTKCFGIDREAYLTKFANDCPWPFYEIAFKCAAVEPEERPPFALLYEWFLVLYSSILTNSTQDFAEFVDEIKNFRLNSSDPPTNTSTPSRPSSALGRLSWHKRKISMDLGYDSVSPGSFKVENRLEIHPEHNSFEEPSSSCSLNNAGSLALCNFSDVCE